MPPTADIPTLEVVAAVLHDGAGRVLVAQRPVGKAQSGWWEFPGGKRHSDETELQCLVRELREELGVEVATADCTPLLDLEHRYPDRLVRLHVWSVAGYAGEVCGREGQQLRWLEPQRLDTVPLLPADAPIVKCLLRDAQRAGRMTP